MAIPSPSGEMTTAILCRNPDGVPFSKHQVARPIWPRLHVASRFLLLGEDGRRRRLPVESGRDILASWHFLGLRGGMSSSPRVKNQQDRHFRGRDGKKPRTGLKIKVLWFVAQGNWDTCWRGGQPNDRLIKGWQPSLGKGKCAPCLPNN